MLIDVKNDFDIDVSFWELYPTLKAAGPSGELYKKDKTKNKSRSSKIMWCIALCFDRSSKYYKLPEEGSRDDGKVAMIFGDYLGDEKYRESNPDVYSKLRNFYLATQESRLERSLREAEEKMEERSRFLMETKYTMGVLCEKTGKYIGGTADLLDKMQSNTDKITTNVEKAIALVVKEQSTAKDGKQKGGAEASLSDQDMI